MINDILSDAITKIEQYQKADAGIQSRYDEPELKAQIDSVVAAMRVLLQTLDAPADKYVAWGEKLGRAESDSYKAMVRRDLAKMAVFLAGELTPEQRAAIVQSLQDYAPLLDKDEFTYGSGSDCAVTDTVYDRLGVLGLSLRPYEDEEPDENVAGIGYLDRSESVRYKARIQIILSKMTDWLVGDLGLELTTVMADKIHASQAMMRQMLKKDVLTTGDRTIIDGIADWLADLGLALQFGGADGSRLAAFSNLSGLEYNLAFALSFASAYIDDSTEEGKLVKKLVEDNLQDADRRGRA